MSDKITAPDHDDQAKPKSAAAIVALVLGVIGLVSSWVPIINNFAFLLAGLGLIFGVVGLIGTLRGKKSGRGLAIASLIVCAIACAVVLATQSAYSNAIDEATKGAVSSSPASAGGETAATDANGSAAEVGAAATTGAEAGAASDAEKYGIEGEEFVADDYNSKICGIYTNKTGVKQGYVQLSYTLFDADGNQVGTAYANTSNLEDGATWKFEASTLKGSDEVASYKLAQVTAF